MRSRTFILAALGAVFAVSAATPAFADYDGWRRHEWREHGRREQAWREHRWREHAWRERQRESYYYRPPVVVVPAYPRYGY